MVIERFAGLRAVRGKCNAKDAKKAGRIKEKAAALSGMNPPGAAALFKCAHICLKCCAGAPCAKRSKICLIFRGGCAMLIAATDSKKESCFE
jgi:hypothetical protein